MTKYRGVPVFMAGTTYIIPALSLRQFEENTEALTAPIEGASALEVFKRSVPIIGLAIRRNYPEITDEALFDMLDLENFNVVMRAVQNASGMKVVAPGEAPDPATSTGAGSTAQ